MEDQIKVPAPCSACKGTGVVFNYALDTGSVCPTCNGKKYLEHVINKYKYKFLEGFSKLIGKTIVASGILEEVVDFDRVEYIKTDDNCILISTYNIQSETYDRERTFIQLAHCINPEEILNFNECKSLDLFSENYLIKSMAEKSGLTITPFYNEMTNETLYKIQV